MGLGGLYGGYGLGGLGMGGLGLGTGLGVGMGVPVGVGTYLLSVSACLPDGVLCRSRCLSFLWVSLVFSVSLALSLSLFACLLDGFFSACLSMSLSFPFVCCVCLCVTWKRKGTTR